MSLELQDVRRSSDDDRYVWTPFELNDQFNGHWWDSPPYLTDDPHFVLARAQGIEVARVELDRDFRGSLQVLVGGIPGRSVSRGLTGKRASSNPAPSRAQNSGWC